jgi:uncharacterized protein (TIGR02300 family)
VDVVKTEWGIKRLCQGCGASFYDMRRDPIICPKCEVRHNPVAVSKPQRSRSAAKPSAPVPKPPLKPEEPDVVETVSDDDKDVLAAGDDVEEVKEDADEEEVIEDASELGEDKDDMFEVIEAVEKKDES